MATIVLVSLKNVQKKARDAVRKKDLYNIQTALEMYYLEHGQYPYSNMVVLDEWHLHVGCGGGNSYYSRSCFANFLQDLVDEGLFSRMPRDPINSDPFAGFYMYLYTNWSTPDDTSPTCTNDPRQFTLITILEKEYNVGDPDCASIPGVTSCIYAITRKQN